MKSLPWFRAYTEMIDDEKLGLLAFEDRWHFVALLCLKGKGVLDREPDAEMLQCKVALKMGLTVAELEKVISRLARMGLVDKDTFQPLAWDERQMQSDQDLTNAQRQQRYRERHKKPVTGNSALRNAPVTGIEEDTDTDKEEEKKEDTPRKRSAPPPSVVKPDDVDPQTWADWCQLRKAKRATVSLTVIDGARDEAAKAGMSLEPFLKIWCRRGSQGLEASWLKPDERGAGGETAYQRTQREKMQLWAPGVAAKAPDFSKPFTIDEVSHVAAIESR